MNTAIKTVHDALTYQLRGLLYAERKIAGELKTCSFHIHSPEVKAELQKYVDNAGNMLLKLDRIFSYLMLEPAARKNEVVNKMIEETKHLLTLTRSRHLKDILMIACMQNLVAYKTASYKTCYLMAMEQELDSAEDLIQQILEWELATGKRLATLSIHEFNKLNNSAKAK